MYNCIMIYLLLNVISICVVNVMCYLKGNDFYGLIHNAILNLNRDHPRYSQRATTIIFLVIMYLVAFPVLIYVIIKKYF